MLVIGFTAVAQPKPVDAFEQNRRLGRGVNIIGYDPIWRSRDQARFQEKHFRLLKEAGFKSVRINLHAFRHMEQSNGWPCATAWLETLDWAVARRTANGLHGRSWTCTSSTPWATIPEAQQAQVPGVLAAGLGPLPERARTASCSRSSMSRDKKLTARALEPVSARGSGHHPRNQPHPHRHHRPGVLELDRSPAGAEAARRRPEPHRHRPLLQADGVHPPGRVLVRPQRQERRQLAGTDAERKARAGRLRQGRRPGRRSTTARFSWASSAPTTRRRWTRGSATPTSCADGGSVGWSWAYWQFDSDFILYDIHRNVGSNRSCTRSFRHAKIETTKGSLAWVSVPREPFSLYEAEAIFPHL